MDTVLLTAALLALAFWVFILHEKIALQQELIDELDSDIANLNSHVDALYQRIAFEQKRNGALHADVTAHSASVAPMLAEMDALERQNNFLRHKRSGKNVEIMRHNVMPHSRGH